MNTTRLGTMLLASVLAPSAIVSVQPAHAAVAAGDVEYCHSDYVIGQNPYCTPVPPNTKDYKGVPIAVQNKVKATGLNYDLFVNVLRNDVIEKKSKIKRIKITYQRPLQTGIHTSVLPNNKIRFRFTDVSWGGYGIMYQVIDHKGRKSDPTPISILVGFGYEG